MSTIKAIVVGRHPPSGAEDIKMVDVDKDGKPTTRPMQFPSTAKQCRPVLEELIEEALEKEVCLIFQGTPAQVYTALHNIPDIDNIVGFIVPIPAPRPSGVVKEFLVDAPHDAGAIQDAVKFATNGRAKAELTQAGPAGGCKVTVDPPMKFEFSHIQWLDGSISNLTLRGLFAIQGLPQAWVSKAGNILINRENSNEFPKVNEGNEVFIDADFIVWTEKFIEFREQIGYRKVVDKLHFSNDADGNREALIDVMVRFID